MESLDLPSSVNERFNLFPFRVNLIKLYEILRKITFRNLMLIIENENEIEKFAHVVQ